MLDALVCHLLEESTDVAARHEFVEGLVELAGLQLSIVQKAHRLPKGLVVLEVEHASADDHEFLVLGREHEVFVGVVFLRQSLQRQLVASFFKLHLRENIAVRFVSRLVRENTVAIRSHGFAVYRHGEALGVGHVPKPGFELLNHVRCSIRRTPHPQPRTGEEWTH